MKGVAATKKRRNEYKSEERKQGERMKRRWLLLLGSLMLMLGIFVPHTAFAEEALPFEYKEPDESVKLFSTNSFDFDEDVYGTRSNFRLYDWDDYSVTNLSPFKVITYNNGTGLYTGNKSTVCDFGYTSVDAEVYSNFDDAIRETVYAGRFHVPNNEDSYILFFEPDATSLSEVVYTCKWSEVLSHVGGSYCGIGNTMKVELVKAITNDDGSVNSGEFKVTYDLAEPCGTLNIRGYDLIELKEGKSGSTTVTINYLTNSEYTFSLHDAEYGTELCSTVYKVDFVKGADEYIEDDVEEDELKVTFKGIPKEAYVGDVIKVEVITNVNSLVNVNGHSLNMDYAKSGIIEINSNGSYPYSITTEGGQSKSGVLKIDCFLKSPDNKERADDYDDGNHLTFGDLIRQNNEKTTNEKKKNVERIGVVIHSDKKKVEVPKTITDENGKKQKVTELGEKAFVKCSNVKQIVLHGNIVYVNKNAFSGISTKDKTIFLDASLTKKEVKKIEKKLRKAGFKGSIVQAKKNPVKKTADK